MFSCSVQLLLHKDDDDDDDDAHRELFTKLNICIHHRRWPETSKQRGPIIDGKQPNFENGGSHAVDGAFSAIWTIVWVGLRNSSATNVKTELHNSPTSYWLGSF